MALKRISTSVQNNLCASMILSSFKHAIEELTYNSLDASSSSIAIRFNINDHSIQVIDNGKGVSKGDLKLMGKKYMTSKTSDIKSLKALSESYGYRGLALWSIVEVSKYVKITSKQRGATETYCKVFKNGSERDVELTMERPSIGTTVEIHGFLFNRKIIRNSINSLTEPQEITKFLQQLSLAYNDVSISLRDNSSNKILFQVNKNRDKIQTLNNLFGIKRNVMQELQVEKSPYKISAFIGNTLNDHKNHHWIYVNNRFIQNSKSHTFFDECLFKLLGLNRKVIRKKNKDIPEEKESSKSLPFYFIFIQCPYSDFNMNENGKHFTVEFENWNNINKILEKLAKLFMESVGPKNCNEPGVQKELKQCEQQASNIDTRDEVKKIINKMLASNSRKLAISQMQNGVRGKIIKRKKKKNKTLLSNKVIPDESVATINNHEFDNNNVIFNHLKDNLKKPDSPPMNFEKNVEIPKLDKKLNKDKVEDKNNKRNRHVSENPQHGNEIVMKSNLGNNSLIKRFKSEPIIVRERCNELAQKAKDVLHCRDKNQVVYKESVKISEHRNRKQIMTIKHKVESIVIRNRRDTGQNIHKEMTKFNNQRLCKSSYDLLETCLKSQRKMHRNDEIDRNRGLMHEVLPSTTQKTYQSHSYESHYNRNSHQYLQQRNEYNTCQNIKMTNQRFITTDSKKAFEEYKNKNHIQRNINRSKHHNRKTLFMFGTRNVEESYSIQFSDSLTKIINNNINYSIDNVTSFGNTNELDKNNLYTNFEQYGYCINSNITINHTTEVRTSNFSPIILNPFEYSQRLMDNSFSTEIVDNNTYIINRQPEKSDKNVQVNLSLDKTIGDMSSKTQMTSYSQCILTQDLIEPLNICETVMSSDHECNKDKAISSPAKDDTASDSLFNTGVLSMPSNAMDTINAVQETSHHFSNIEKTLRLNPEKSIRENTIVLAPMSNTNTLFSELGPVNNETNNCNDVVQLSNEKRFSFNFKRRPRFVPKGLSPIFRNCNKKVACEDLNDDDLNEDCFSDSMYNDFARVVETNAEILEANVEKLNGINTREIEKFSAKISKQNSSLSFTGDNLREAKILGQVDCKFIACKMMGGSSMTAPTNEYLVLFDQHAVHERVRLEKNLEDYLKNDKWESIDLDQITITLQQDDMVYLHNYQDKFAQLGLKWTCNGNEVSITGIPKAVLGKNSRSVEVIMKAVKNLILEEIDSIKSQKGCVNLYPKSIMNLVFSEACRYAIKFGDKLTREKCAELISSLSHCKTPFQCAHGRPVMAVLFNIEASYKEYKINIESLGNFQRKRM